MENGSEWTHSLSLGLLPAAPMIFDKLLSPLSCLRWIPSQPCHWLPQSGHPMFGGPHGEPLPAWDSPRILREFLRTFPRWTDSRTPGGTVTSGWGYSMGKIWSSRENQPNYPCLKGWGPSPPSPFYFLTLSLVVLRHFSVIWSSESKEQDCSCRWGQRTPFLSSPTLFPLRPLPFLVRSTTDSSNSLGRICTCCRLIGGPSCCWLTLSYLASFSPLSFLLCSCPSSRNLDLRAKYHPTCLSEPNNSV